MQDLQVAVVQMVSGTDVAANIATMRRLVREAAAGGAQWVLLPEYWPIMGQGETDKLAYAEILGQGVLQDALSSLARELGIVLFGGTVPLQGAFATMTEAFHTSEAGAPTGFIVRLPSGYTLYHSGDTGIFANMATWGVLYPIDLALLPVGDVFTMDGRQAAMATKMLGAKAAVPMHYGTFPRLAQTPDAFIQHLEQTAPACRCKVMQPGQTLSLPL